VRWQFLCALPDEGFCHGRNGCRIFYWSVESPLSLCRTSAYLASQLWCPDAKAIHDNCIYNETFRPVPSLLSYPKCHLTFCRPCI